MADEKERFKKALEFMKTTLGVPVTATTPILRQILKVYGSEWSYIEAENYRVLADSYFELQDEQKILKSSDGEKRAVTRSMARGSNQEHTYEITGISCLLSASSFTMEHGNLSAPVKTIECKEKRRNCTKSETRIGNSFEKENMKQGVTSLRQPKIECVELGEVDCEKTKSYHFNQQHFLESSGTDEVRGSQMHEGSKFLKEGPSAREVQLSISCVQGEDMDPESACTSKALSVQADPEETQVGDEMVVSSISLLRFPSQDSNADGTLSLPTGDNLEPLQREWGSLRAIVEAYGEISEDSDQKDLLPPSKKGHIVETQHSFEQSLAGTSQRGGKKSPRNRNILRDEDRKDLLSPLKKAHIVETQHSFEQLLVGTSQRGGKRSPPNRNILRNEDWKDLLPPSKKSHTVETQHLFEQSLAGTSQRGGKKSPPNQNILRNEDLALVVMKDGKTQCAVTYGKSGPLTKSSSEKEACATSFLEPILLNIRGIQAESEKRRRHVHDLNDISGGLEKVPVSVAKDSPIEKFPDMFYYIAKSVTYQNAYVGFSLARIDEYSCCAECNNDCLKSDISCMCARETGGEYAYGDGGQLWGPFLEKALEERRECGGSVVPERMRFCESGFSCPLERVGNPFNPKPCKGHPIRKFIKECWVKCGCGQRCGNRVVQRGINYKLQVFYMPEGKGWGVRTLEYLPRGTFVCEYAGEILTNIEAGSRNRLRKGDLSHYPSHYPVLLDADWGSENVPKDNKALCLDATYYGNVARFVNHRCHDANLLDIPVEIESPDHYYYHVAFFTTRPVYPYEELTWDYCIDFEDRTHPIQAFECLCGSKFCRGRKRHNFNTRA